jgi:protein-tyrosine phosphatase
VILDVETSPHALPRLQALALDLARTITEGTSPVFAQRPPRIYVLCQYGMNRSGLMAGLLLRALGEEPDSVVSLIRRLRPGSLSNQTFVTLIEAWQPSCL